MRTLTIVIREDSDEEARAILRGAVQSVNEYRQLFGTAEPHHPDDEYVYRAYVSEPGSDRFIPNGSSR